MLAIVLREGGLSVAVVDGDLRRPSLSRLFGEPSEPGLTDVLTGEATLAEALRRVHVKVKGVAALQISRDMNIHFKSAFVLLHKLREAMAAEVHSVDELGGPDQPSRSI